MARSRAREFAYKPDYETAVKMAERRFGFDQVFKDGTKLYKPKQGVNAIRILPPLWPDPDWIGVRISAHYDVGPKNKQYLCLLPGNNPTSPYKRCPICDALRELGKGVSQKERQELMPSASWIFYIIDRDNEAEGVQLWRTSEKNNTELTLQTIHRRNKSVLNITEPEEGYDVEFTRIGEGKNGTRYHGFMVMRESSPLSDSENRAKKWLAQAKENPLPDILQFFKPDYIEEEFYGRAKDDEDDEEKPRRARANGRAEPDEEEDEDERPLRRTRTRSDPDEDEEEETPRRGRRPDPDDEEEEAPARGRQRRRAAEPDEEEEEEEAPRTRKRTQLSKDLDDEIPFEEDKPARRRRASNGAADEEEEEPAPPRGSRRRRAPEPDEEEEPAPPRGRRRPAAEPDEDEEEEAPAPKRGRARKSADEDEEEEDYEPPRGKRRARTDDEDEDRHGRARSRVRERLDRG